MAERERSTILLQIFERPLYFSIEEQVKWLMNQFKPTESVTNEEDT